MSTETTNKTKLEAFRPNSDICGGCRMDLNTQGWAILCGWCQTNLEKIYSLEIVEIDYHDGEVYSV